MSEKKQEYHYENYMNSFYKKDPTYHLGVKAMQFHTPNEVRQLREKLTEAVYKNGPGYILTDNMAITWTKDIRYKSPRLLRFLHRLVWWFTAPNSDAWRRWVLYRTIKET